MIAQEPNIQKTARYSINETCNILKIHRGTLFRYTKQGIIKCGYRKNNGRKFYKGIDIVALWKAQF